MGQPGSVEMQAICVLLHKLTLYKGVNTSAWVEHVVFCYTDSRGVFFFFLSFSFFFSSLAGAYTAHLVSC